MTKYLLAFLFYSCIQGCTNLRSEEASSPNISLVTVEPGVQLELIDWGGNGEPILFLAGLGNTAHVFDEYAPQFTDQFRVLALTRRGFGASSRPPGGYDLATLSRDILTIIDSLSIERITLIGHSIAGEELTKFAILYPQRVNKLVYLDAAYDRTDLSFADKSPPAPFKMTAEDSSSWQNLQSYLKRTYKLKLTEAEIKATSIFDKKGRLVRDATPDSIYGAFIRLIEKPAFDSIQAPALSIYNVGDSIRDIFTYYDQLDSAAQLVAMEVFHEGQLFQRGQIELFKTKMKQGKVVELHRSDHYLIFSRPEEVAREIRGFLGK